MPPSYSDYSENESGSLWVAAHNLRDASKKTCRLSPFVFMSDPKRGDSPVEIAQKLPKGAALIYRHFGADDRKGIALQLREITAARGIQFLIGADPRLAREAGADGVHFTRDATLREPKVWRIKEPDWIITMAALKGAQDYADNLSSLDAIFVSSIFPSKSPTAGEPIGVKALTDICKELQIPAYALGGVKAGNAAKLLGSSAAGIAAIDGIMKEIVMAEIEVEQTSYGHRFVYRKSGHKDAELTMKRLDDDLFNANHTGVPKSMGGQGVGKALIKTMSDHARKHNYRVTPGCPFVEAMWKRNPDWANGIRA